MNDSYKVVDWDLRREDAGMRDLSAPTSAADGLAMRDMDGRNGAG